MNINDVARVFFLTSSDESWHDILKKIGYNISYTTLNNQIKSFDDDGIICLLTKILQISGEYAMNKEDVSMALFKCLNRLNFIIWLWKIPKKDVYKYVWNLYYVNPLTKSNFYSISKKIAERSIELNSDPAFMSYLIQQHIWIDCDITNKDKK